MNRLLIIFFCLPLLVLPGSCKKKNTPSPAFADAYTRFIFMDAPGQAQSQLYLDGVVNANGDSSIDNPNGSVYQPDNTISTSTVVDYASGGWTDNSPPNFVGTFGYNYAPANTYADFPNPTDRIPIAPVIGNYNYFNWAALSAQQHELTLYSVVPATLYGNPISVKGSAYLDQPITLEGGAVQTFFVVNEAPCKAYVPGGINASNGLPIYAVAEQIDYFSNSFGIVSVKDHPDKLPAFKDSSAYVRFMNVTPYFSNQSTNQNTQSIDVYLQPVYGTNPNVFSFDRDGFSNSVDSIGAEFLVAQNLNRFQSSVDAPFYELNVAANMRNNNAGPDDSLSHPRVARYYRVLVYIAGHANATGDLPLAQGDWLAVFSQFGAYDHSDDLLNEYPLGTEVDSWLLRSDGTNYHPAICTIPIAVSDDLYPFTVNTQYLGFRSCINYIKAGTNSVYFGN